MAHELIFFHNPQSRAVMVHWMLEEVGATYETRIVDFNNGENRKPEFLAINPMGKVPTLVVDGTPLTEAPAIIAWLADAYPDAGLAPGIGSIERGTWYRWLFFGGSALEVAIVDKMLQRPVPESKAALGYGSYEDALGAVEKALAGSDYLVGNRFSAADLYIAAELSWGLMTGNPGIKDDPVFTAFIRRCTDREGYRRSIGATLGDVELD